MKITKLLHGGDYNPEQWLEYPEVLEEDIRLMKEAQINCVSLGIFSWASLEPEENKYEMGWLKTIIHNLYKNEIYTILATPTGGMPHWLTEKYPEVMQVQSNGQKALPGKRHNFCYTSPTMRNKMSNINTRLSAEFGSDPAVILWHISNEYGGNFGDASCHCENCQQEFRRWVKDKYQTLEELNHAWWTKFWSHTYTGFEQVHSPTPHGENLLHGLNLDWHRFVSQKITEFCEAEIKAVKTNSLLPVTTNFMEFFKPLDYHKFQECLDIVSWDSYPAWHSEKDEINIALRAAVNHSLMRSMKKKPFLLMESTPSATDWKNSNPIKRPGMHALSSLQAIANGSDSVQYFQWRKSRGSVEKFHGAVLGHQNGSDTRTFREVQDLGKRLNKLSEQVLATCNRPKAAFIFDWENWWALEDSTGPRRDINYVNTILAHYSTFWSAGIDVDFISMDYDISAYSLVCAPINYMYKKGYAQKVESYVKNGGVYVTTYWSGLADENDLCFLDAHPLANVLGIIQEEIDAPGPDFSNSVLYRGKEYAAGSLCEVIHAKNAEILGVYTDDYYKGMPAVTQNDYGKGKAYYLAAEFCEDFLTIFYEELLHKLSLRNSICETLPKGVTVNKRVGENTIYFVQNYNHSSVELSLKADMVDAETGGGIEKVLNMEALSCKILRDK